MFLFTLIMSKHLYPPFNIFAVECVPVVHKKQLCGSIGCHSSLAILRDILFYITILMVHEELTTRDRFSVVKEYVA